MNLQCYSESKLFSNFTSISNLFFILFIFYFMQKCQMTNSPIGLNAFSHNVKQKHNVWYTFSLINLCLDKKINHCVSCAVPALFEVRDKLCECCCWKCVSLYISMIVIWRKRSDVVVTLLLTVPLHHSPGWVTNMEV